MSAVQARLRPDHLEQRGPAAPSSGRRSSTRPCWTKSPRPAMRRRSWATAFRAMPRTLRSALQERGLSMPSALVRARVLPGRSSRRTSSTRAVCAAFLAEVGASFINLADQGTPERKAFAGRADQPDAPRLSAGAVGPAGRARVPGGRDRARARPAGDVSRPRRHVGRDARRPRGAAARARRRRWSSCAGTSATPCAAASIRSPSCARIPSASPTSI